jgi:Uma2 family endonuclease
MSLLNNALSSSSIHKIRPIKELFRSQDCVLIDSEKVDKVFVFQQVDSEEVLLCVYYFLVLLTRPNQFPIHYTNFFTTGVASNSSNTS